MWVVIGRFGFGPERLCTFGIVVNISLLRLTEFSRLDLLLSSYTLVGVGVGRPCTHLQNICIRQLWKGRTSLLLDARHECDLKCPFGIPPCDPRKFCQVKLVGSLLKLVFYPSTAGSELRSSERIH